MELEPSLNPNTTVVLVGKTGNGKSATGNSILGRMAFVAKASSSGITSTCGMQSSVLEDGRGVLNVIDTPGLFDYSAGSNVIGKEIVKCMDLAKDGIHAVLLVLSVRSRFSREEEASLNKLEALFGEKLFGYMIVVFTGGDEIKDCNETLEYYLDRECPDTLRRILSRCENRMVLFDNKTTTKEERLGQLNMLLSLVDLVIENNSGLPYSNEYFAKLKSGALNLHDKERDGLLQQMTETVEQKLKQHLIGLETQIVEEYAARCKAEEVAKEHLAAEQAAISKAEEHAMLARAISEYQILRRGSKAEKIAPEHLAAGQAASLKAEEHAPFTLICSIL